MACCGFERVLGRAVGQISFEYLGLSGLAVSIISDHNIRSFRLLCLRLARGVRFGRKVDSGSNHLLNLKRRYECQLY